MSRPEILYSCATLAKPILHNTVLQLSIIRELSHAISTRQHSYSNLFLDDDENDSKEDPQDTFGSENIHITGSVVTSLKVSLTRSQYEQLLDTVQWLTSCQKLIDESNVKTNQRHGSALSNICEEDTGVTTLKMDPHVRAKLFPTMNLNKPKDVNKSNIGVKISFELPIFTIELRGDSPTGEQGLVDLSFRDFIFVYEKCHRYETNLQVSLRSIFMEDLLQPEGSKQRSMVVSSSDEIPLGSICVSRSCPDILGYQQRDDLIHGSLPENLEYHGVLGKNNLSVNFNTEGKKCCPCTPPPSPSLRERAQKNLVIISTLLVDPNAPNFHTNYNSIQRSTSIDFNCLDLVISVESWVVVLDFFSAAPTNPDGLIRLNSIEAQERRLEKISQNTETKISVRSLTMVLVKPDRDVARANISKAEVSIKTGDLMKEVEGKLGSMSLFDLTSHGQLYRERFLSSGKQALHFNYLRHAPDEMLNYDCQLKLKMSSVVYVHTKRFVNEIQSFFNHFTQLQAVMSGIRAATSGQMVLNVYF